MPTLFLKISHKAALAIKEKTQSNSISKAVRELLLQTAEKGMAKGTTLEAYEVKTMRVDGD
jgi:hypothetical protein